jgi:hypothetical protein
MCQEAFLELVHEDNIFTRIVEVHRNILYALETVSLTLFTHSVRSLRGSIFPFPHLLQTVARLN